MSKNIALHFSETRQKQHRLVDEMEARAADLRNQIDRRLAEMKELRSKRNQSAKALEIAEAAGEDAPKLKSRVADLDDLISRSELETGNLERNLEQNSVPSKLSFQLHDRLAEILSNHFDCKEAIEVKSIDDCWAMLGWKIKETDSAGQVLECEIDLGCNQVRNIRIVPPSGRYLRDFRPKELQWLPRLSPESTKESDRGISAYRSQMNAFIDVEGQLVLSKSLLRWVEYGDRIDYSTQRRESKEAKQEFSEIARPLGTRFDELAGTENGQLDLAKEYPSNPVMYQLRNFVLGKTTDKPIFEPSRDTPSSSEVYKTIKSQWDLFTNCPWSSSIVDPFALLKYSVENGERVRFWQDGFKNYYGFRMRTRDHNWISGKIYIDPSSNPKSGLLRINSEAHGHSVANIGTMWMCITR
jgi:hypothetical protein